MVIAARGLARSLEDEKKIYYIYSPDGIYKYPWERTYANRKCASNGYPIPILCLRTIVILLAIKIMVIPKKNRLLINYNNYKEYDK